MHAHGSLFSSIITSFTHIHVQNFSHPAQHQYCLDIAANVMDSQALFTPPVGCPCTPQLLCKTDRRGIMDEACSFPGNMDTPFDDIIYSMDGGSGALLSVGLLQALDFAEVEDCVINTNGSASDHIFTFCMWQLGYAHAHPMY